MFLFHCQNEPNAIFFYNGKGSKYRYTQDATDPNKYISVTNKHRYFEFSDNKFTLITATGLEYAFNATDKLESITDENGNSIIFDYDVNGLSTITDDLERVINVSCDANGFIETITDFAGRTWQYYYDSYELVGVTGPNTPDYPDGLTTAYDYDDHNLVSITDPNEDLFVYNYYDALDRVYQQDIGDSNYLFDYDVNKTAITDREGYKTEMVYGASGQLTSQIVYTEDSEAEPNSFTTTYEYDPNTRQRTRIVYPAGNCTDFNYDDSGRLTGIYQKTIPSDYNDPNDPNVIATLYTYDPNFVYKIKTTRDPEGNITTYDYNDVTGNLEKITHPVVKTPDGNESPVETFTYNDYGQVETITGADGIVTKYVYYDDSDPNDPNCGKLWKVIIDANESDPNCLEITTEYTYDALGRVIEVNDPNGNITQNVYNNLDQLAKIIDPLEHVTKFSYDHNGNRSKTEREVTDEPNQITSFTYNVRSKLIKMTDPLNNDTTYGYNKNEEPNIVTDAEDNSTIAEYNERGLITKVTDANSGVTELTYDENGNLTDINDPNSNVTHYDYDGLGQLEKIIYPDDSNEVFTYDKNGNKTRNKTRKGDTIDYEYDAMNRMIVKNRPGDPNIYFTYDIAGRLVDVNDGRDVNDGGGITTYKYDRIGRVIEVNDIYSRVVEYEYDELGRRTELSYPGGGTITYEYDELSRLERVKYGSATLAEYDYDELSRRILLTLDNDTNTVYEYDIGNRLKKLTHNLNGGETIVFDYNDYDKVGNRLSMKVDDANAHVYDYDDLYQLTFVDYNDGNSTNYYYDKLGNRTSATNGGTVDYNNNSLNQYTSVNDVNYEYDENGNLTNDGTYKYYYDCENRLIDVNNQSDQVVASYRYDYLGRRVRKTVGATVTTYCYDGDQVIAEYKGSLRIGAFIYGAGIDEPIVMDTNGMICEHYCHFDGLGSVVALSDPLGDIAERYSYDVFGEPNRVSTLQNPYMFTGRRYDTETGLYYYRARYYNPYLGRFMQTDPIGYLDGLNLYSYVHNNPVNLVDPLGLAWTPGGPGFGPVVGGGTGCCLEYGPSLAEMLGVSNIECANMIMGEAWRGIRTPIGIIGGIIGIPVPAVGIGLGIGLGAQYATALAYCSYHPCLEWE